MSRTISDSYLEPTDKNVVSLLARKIEGPVTMLNLLRLRGQADYSAHPHLAPASPITGRQAYAKYISHTLPYLRESGGELVYLGAGGRYLIGPEDEGWDLVMLVRQRSVEAFIEFARNEGYLRGIGHRVAAVRDSRIVPLVDIDTAVE